MYECVLLRHNFVLFPEIASFYLSIAILNKRPEVERCLEVPKVLRPLVSVLTRSSIIVFVVA